MWSVIGGGACDGPPPAPVVHPKDLPEPVALPVSCTAPPPGAAPLSLRFEVETVLRDLGPGSSTTRNHAVFDGASVVLTGPVGPCVRNRCEKATVSWFLDSAEREKLNGLLAEERMWGGVVYEEVALLPHAYMSRTIRLELSEGGRTTSSRVRYSDARDRTEPVPPGATALEQGVDQLVSMLRQQARRCHPSFRLGG